MKYFLKVIFEKLVECLVAYCFKLATTRLKNKKKKASQKASPKK